MHKRLLYFLSRLFARGNTQEQFYDLVIRRVQPRTIEPQEDFRNRSPDSLVPIHKIRFYASRW